MGPLPQIRPVGYIVLVASLVVSSTSLSPSPGKSFGSFELLIPGANPGNDVAEQSFANAHPFGPARVPRAIRA